MGRHHQFAAYESCHSGCLPRCDPASFRFEAYSGRLVRSRVSVWYRWLRPQACQGSAVATSLKRMSKSPEMGVCSWLHRSREVNRPGAIKCCARRLEAAHPVRRRGRAAGRYFPSSLLCFPDSQARLSSRVRRGPEPAWNPQAALRHSGWSSTGPGDKRSAIGFELQVLAHRVGHLRAARRNNRGQPTRRDGRAGNGKLVPATPPVIRMGNLSRHERSNQTGTVVTIHSSACM